MAGSKATSKKSDGCRARDSKNAAGSALIQAPNHRPGGNGRARPPQPSADELGRRAWEATYKNRHKN